MYFLPNSVPFVKGTATVSLMDRDLCNVFYQVECQTLAVPGIEALDLISTQGNTVLRNRASANQTDCPALPKMCSTELGF